MKILILSLLAMAATSGVTSAQGSSCPSKVFPYFFCDKNGNPLVKCSADPHREPGLTPSRAAEAPCMIPAGIYQKSVLMAGLPGPQVIEVFNPYDGVLDLNAAWNQWVTLCPNTQGQPSNANCCVKVWMSESPVDFSDPIRDAYNFAKSRRVSARTCRIICDKPFDIFVNFTEAFFWEGGDPTNSAVTRSWYTGNVAPKNRLSTLYGKSYSFRRNMEYCFGLSLGLANREGGTGCDDMNTVMGNPITQDDDRGLTNDDRCQFVKLYCPEVVGLQPALGVEDESASGISLSQNAPNPFATMTAIPYSLQKGGQVVLRIYDNMGKDVKTLVDGHMDAGRYTYGFVPDAAMSAGTYWYVLHVDGAVVTKQMILVK